MWLELPLRGTLRPKPTDHLRSLSVISAAVRPAEYGVHLAGPHDVLAVMFNAKDSENGWNRADLLGPLVDARDDNVPDNRHAPLGDCCAAS